MTNVDISVVIATRNRETILWETVGKACVAIKSRNAEIIIVNDGDAPLTVPELLKDKVRYFDNPGKGVSAARNFGASNAKGAILFFVDDDMWLNSECIYWINKNVDEKGNTEAVYFINWVYPDYLNRKLKKSKLGRYILAGNYNTLWGRIEQKTAVPAAGLFKFDKIGSCSLVMTKAIFNNIGGYDDSIIFAGEDEDLENKINRLGIPIYIVFDVTLQHNHQDRLDLKIFIKRIYDGYASEFKAIKAGIITPRGSVNYGGAKKMIFDFFRITEKGWIILHKILPNANFVQPVQNKLIGILGGLQKYKQWRKVIYLGKQQ